MTNGASDYYTSLPRCALDSNNTTVHGGPVLRASGPRMSSIKMDPDSPSSLPGRATTSKGQRTVSSSPSSPGYRHHNYNHNYNPRHRHHRSVSRSTGRSGLASGRSSPLSVSHRRAPTSASLTPSVHGRCHPDQKRDTLLALHRESCRLFQGQGQGQGTTTRPASSMAKPVIYAPSAASSDIGTPPASPRLYARSSSSERSLDHGHVDGDSTLVYQVRPAEPSKQPSNMVIDWTSPSTRRREYAKIDRASRGVRGLWRRVAPRWCQFGNDRMPFFDPGKPGKADDEGSVRRFRMDLPDEPGLSRSSHRGIGLRLGGRRNTAA